jgi:hypothetical protein
MEKVGKANLEKQLGTVQASLASAQSAPNTVTKSTSIAGHAGVNVISQLTLRVII